MAETWTVLRLLTWCRDYFQTKGIDSPRLDAEVLLAHVLGVDRVGVYLRYDQPLAAGELEAVRTLVKRRGQREPVAHLVGHKEFFGLSFLVDARVLTPRPETELLVETLLQWPPPDAPRAIGEVGTGTGCIAVALAKQRPSWNIVATDSSPAALAVAETNAQRHEVTDRVRLVHADLFGELSGPFDAVVSNPPYVPTAECLAAMPEVSQFEPRAALDGGPDGLAIVRRLIAESPRVLRGGGLLALECGHDQAEQIVALLRTGGVWDQVGARRDLAGIKRVVTARRKE
jgi:release factor glutamine methyltransferase